MFCNRKADWLKAQVQQKYNAQRKGHATHIKYIAQETQMIMSFWIFSFKKCVKKYSSGKAYFSLSYAKYKG